MMNRKCEYYACGKEIAEADRKNKRFCNRNCKVKNRKMKIYWKKKQEKLKGEE